MSQCLSVVPIEIFRWVIAGVAGFMSACFVALNLRTHIKSAGERWFLIVAGIFLLQLGLAVILKLYFFTITVWRNYRTSTFGLKTSKCRSSWRWKYDASLSCFPCTHVCSQIILEYLMLVVSWNSFIHHTIELSSCAVWFCSVLYYMIRKQE